ncbi:MAG: hypothetical protein ACK4WM_05320 [Thermoflexales bacterium]
MSQACPCVWLHGDSLRPEDPALAANPDAPAVFVFDEPLLRRLGLSFKRLMFIYECVEEAFASRVAPTAIFRGAVPECVLSFARQHGCDTIHTTATESPGFRRHVQTLRQSMPVVLHTPPLFLPPVPYQPRFSRFWRLVEADAFRLTTELEAEWRARSQAQGRDITLDPRRAA